MINDQQTVKDIRFDADARTRLIEGINQLADAVQTTLGPGGRNVIITRIGQAPIVTKDGVTVASHVKLKDPHHDAGARVVLEAASRTNDVAGDGTTTATVLAREIVRLGQKALAAGHHPKLVKAGMELAATDVIAALRESATAIVDRDQIEHVGTISANGDNIVGCALASAMKAVGTQGIITIEDAKGLETQLELIDGVRLDRGYTSPYFVNDVETMCVEFENPYVLLSDCAFKTIPDVLPLLELVRKEGRALLIVADEVRDDALKIITTNKARGNLQACVIVAPGRGESRVELLGDLAAVLGGDVLTTGDGRTLVDFDVAKLGTCEKIVVTRNDTTFIGGGGVRSDTQRRDVRQHGVEEKLKDVTLDSRERDLLNARLSILTGAAAIIKVGGATEVELGERKDRVVDALNATRAAAQEGIVAGGGLALLRARDKCNAVNITNDDVRVGYNIVLRACDAPMKQILENAGFDASKVLAKLDDVDPDVGFNAATGAYVKMIEDGIVDPVKVTRSALENAVSVGGIVLTVGASIVDA